MDAFCSTHYMRGLACSIPRFATLEHANNPHMPSCSRQLLYRELPTRPSPVQSARYAVVDSSAQFQLESTGAWWTLPLDDDVPARMGAGSADIGWGARGRTLGSLAHTLPTRAGAAQSRPSTRDRTHCAAPNYFAGFLVGLELGPE